MDKLVEKWRSRHAHSDALGMWAASTGAEAKELAFNAIARDPQVLHRAVRPQAGKMAAQAEDFAQSLMASSAVGNDTLRAVTLLVQKSITAWRHSLKAYDRHTDGIGAPSNPPMVQVPCSDPWEVARRNFPYVDDATGRLATRLLHEFGTPLLRRTRKPWDHVIALAVLRYAARLLRDELSECEPGCTSATAIDDILSLQSYAENSGLSPMMVGYSGPGKPAAQALSLWRDARTLRDAVSGYSECASVWQRAIDFHAFAIVALNRRILLYLPLDDAYELAAAATRQAEDAMRSPDLVKMPSLPDGSSFDPDLVRLHARACLRPESADELQSSRRDYNVVP